MIMGPNQAVADVWGLCRIGITVPPIGIGPPRCGRVMIGSAGREEFLTMHDPPSEPPMRACKQSDDREKTMKLLRHLLNETLVGAVVYAITCRLSSDGRPYAGAGRVGSDKVEVTR